MKTIRLKQTGVFYPFFKSTGRGIAGFYWVTLFNDSTATISAPMLGREFTGPVCDTLAAAHEAIGQALGVITGKVFSWPEAAMSQAYDGETRAYTLTE